ncbi:MAG: helix-turn-helix domain-containing protein [Methylococcales bacterium]|nr:helix-turn-helix domain-containing protein [Methylococcales bacterium]
MIRIKEITAEERATLEDMKKNHPVYTPRMRAHAVLLCESGFDVQEIAEIFGVCRQSAATWMRGWSKHGICALLDKPRSGRPRKVVA